MSEKLAQKISNKTAQIAVIGLGFVGLSLMEAFGEKGFSVRGYDKNKHKIDILHNKESYLTGVHLNAIHNLLISGHCRASHDAEILDGADIFIITVPTSLDLHGSPDLSKVKSASHLIGKYIKNDSLVIMQSTSYPGTTEEVVLSCIAKKDFKPGYDFHLAFIPEISDFGGDKFTFANIPKIVGGLTGLCSELAASLYRHITRDVTIVSSPKVAEAAKILQNTYRLINISLINEMKMMFEKMGIDIWEVIEAAKKKPFGFCPFYPGPGIGGDCIPVDPVYLLWKAKENQAPTTMIERALQINDSLTEYVVHKVIYAINTLGKTSIEAKVLILGAAFKKDVNDIRQSCSIKILSALIQQNINIEYHDPYVSNLFLPGVNGGINLCSLKWEQTDLSNFDCVVILTDHSFYDFEEILKKAIKIVDTRNCYPNNKGSKQKVIKA